MGDPEATPPKAEGCSKGGVTLYQGCWLPSGIVQNVISFQQTFKAQDHDIIIASFPKSGTTWLKSLAYSICNRRLYTPTNTPLLTTNPHLLMPLLEYPLSANPQIVEMTTLPSPRLLSTHIPYALLPDEITRSSGKLSPPPRIVYICRNPLDTVVSRWHFASQTHMLMPPGWTLEQCVGSFCEGQNQFGPIWSHVLGYWKASLESPESVLFLKYENMLDDTVSHVKRLARFMGLPFSAEEESNGVVEQIIELCSLGKLKELDVNKHGELIPGVENKSFFRKGEVGDWVNHLSPSMVEKIEKVIQQELGDSGLTFKYRILAISGMLLYC